MSSSVCARAGDNDSGGNKKFCRGNKSRSRRGTMECRANRVAPKTKHTNPHRAAAFVPNMHSIWQHIKHGALLIEIIFLICAPMDTPKGRDSLWYCPSCDRHCCFCISSEAIHKKKIKVFSDFEWSEYLRLASPIRVELKSRVLPAFYASTWGLANNI